MASSSESSGRVGWSVVAIVAVLAALAFVGVRAGGTTTTFASSNHYRTSPRVGPLFSSSTTPMGHHCNASLIHSPSHNLIITAAHCVTGKGEGLRFAAGYRDGIARYGVWDVEAVYVDPAWVARQDPARDWAFLALAPQTINGREVNLEDTVPGFQLGFRSHPSQSILVYGYRATDDVAVGCVSRLRIHHRYAQFNCRGLTGGIDGAPLLLGPYGHRHLLGVVGGLDDGGCYSNITYSAQFGWPMWLSYLRAAAGGPSDVLPAPHERGCDT
jgi:Trypsin